jgi:hypothetical protein
VSRAVAQEAHAADSHMRYVSSTRADGRSCTQTGFIMFQYDFPLSWGAKDHVQPKGLIRIRQIASPARISLLTTCSSTSRVGFTRGPGCGGEDSYKAASITNAYISRMSGSCLYSYALARRNTVTSRTADAHVGPELYLILSPQPV